jgi:hypothetical protein
MSSSMNKSPVCDGERDSSDECHSKWEVFGQDHQFDEYQCDIRHPDLPDDGHVNVTMTKDDAMIEATIDDGEIPHWPYGQIHLALKEIA